jgi:hypothetical protein
MFRIAFLKTVYDSHISYFSQMRFYAFARVGYVYWQIKNILANPVF